MNIRFLICPLFIFIVSYVYGQQKYITRTAHIHVQSANKFMDIEADNYQVASVFDAKTGVIDFIGLLKSFEFKLGAIDQLFNSRVVDVSEHPQLLFVGEIYDIDRIDFSKSGEYIITVNGILYLWDEKRNTSATGTLTINSDGTIKVISEFTMIIEEGSVEKTNKLMREKLPKVVSIDVETLGISREIAVSLNMTYKSKNSIR